MTPEQRRAVENVAEVEKTPPHTEVRGTISDEVVQDWKAANRALVALLTEVFGAVDGVDYQRLAEAYQARLTYLDPPLVVARMDRVYGDETTEDEDDLPAEQPVKDGGG